MPFVSRFMICFLAMTAVAAAEDLPSLAPREIIAAIEKMDGNLYPDKKRPNNVRVWLQNDANDAGLAVLARIPNLSQLDLVNAKNVTTRGMEQIGKLSTLRELNLEGTNVGDSGIEQIGQLVELESLSLIDSSITDAGLAHLHRLSKLKRLKLSFNEISDKGLPHLESLKSLRILELDDTKVTGAAVQNFQTVLPKCKIATNIAANVTVKRDTPSAPGVAENGNCDWPQWRGANRDGVSSESRLLQQWPAEGPRLRWEASGMGWGHSTIITSDGMLYATGTIDGQSRVSALDVATGEHRWHRNFASGNEFVLSTPTLDGSLLFALASDGELACIDIASHEIRWHRNLAKDFGGRIQSPGAGGGFAESVLIDGDRLICTPGGPAAMMAALDKQTGATLWQAKMPADVGKQGTDAASFSSAVISTAGGIRQYVQNTGRGLMGVSADGKVLWTYNRIANTYANIPTPLAYGDFVFASTAHSNDGNSGTVLLKLTSTNGNITAEEVYRLPERVVSNHHGGMIRLGNYVYLGHGYNRGFPLCLELATGKVVWRPGRGPGTGSASLVYADERLYFHYEDGSVALVEATPTRFVVTGQFKGPPSDNPEWSHPVISDGNLFIRSQNQLRCYDIARDQ